MRNTTVSKVTSAYSPHGPSGQRYLASGVGLSMRMWDHEPPGPEKLPTRRDYETVGYVIEGRAELHLEGGQMIMLEPGDSWVVPRGEEHRYHVLEAFTAIEATHPPAHVHGRDG